MVGHRYAALPDSYSDLSALFAFQAVAHVSCLPGAEVFRSLRKKQLQTFSKLCVYFFTAESIETEKESPIIEESLT